MSPTNPDVHARALTLGDIADSRADEREREEFRSHVAVLKQRRRLAVGPLVPRPGSLRATLFVDLFTDLRP